jgi:hypothetical protein
MNGRDVTNGSANMSRTVDVSTPATDEARQWSGWGTAAKPAHEPIILARKPLSEKTVAANVLKWGTGALNIDATRVGENGGARRGPEDIGVRCPDPNVVFGKGLDLGNAAPKVDGLGRWPGNVLLTHSADCASVGTQLVKGDRRAGQRPGSRPRGFVDTGADSGDDQPNGVVHGDQVVEAWDCDDSCPVAALDAQSGVSASKSSAGRQTPKQGTATLGNFNGTENFAGHDDKGGASRFFSTFAWSPEYDVPFMYCAKAPKRERPRVPALVMRLRDDLTGEQQAYVLNELRKAGVRDID